MGVYLFAVFICLICAFRYDMQRQAKGYNWAFWGVCALLIVIAGLRYKIGADTVNYMDDFSYVRELSRLSAQDFDNTRFMPGWILFASACKSICPQFVGLQFVHAIILNVSIFIFIRAFAQYRFTAILMYVLLAYLNLNTEILRESLAMSVFLLAAAAFVRNRWPVYLLLCLAASMIHVSGIITFLFPIGKLLSIHSRKKLILAILGTLVLSGSIWKLFQEHIIDFFVMKAIQEGAEAYLNDEHTYNLNGIIVHLITRCIAPLLVLFYALKFTNKSRQLIQLTYIYAVIGAFILFNSVIFLRFQTYVTIPFLIIMGDTLTSLIRQRQSSVALLLFAASAIPLYYSYFKHEVDINNTTLKEYIYQRYVPYQTWPAAFRPR